MRIIYLIISINNTGTLKVMLVVSLLSLIVAFAVVVVVLLKQSEHSVPWHIFWLF